jgi:uncharacterized protein (TIGR00369 family)
VSIADAIAAARAAGKPGDLCRLIPYHERLGLRAELRDGELLGVLAFSPDLIGNHLAPALHGGAIGSLLESTAVLQLMWDGPGVLPKTIGVTIDFLRPGRPVDTFARGAVTKQGRRVTNVRVEAWQDDRARPIAVAHGHFLIASDE